MYVLFAERSQSVPLETQPKKDPFAELGLLGASIGNVAAAGASPRASPAHTPLHQPHQARSPHHQPDYRYYLSILIYI